MFATDHERGEGGDIFNQNLRKWYNFSALATNKQSHAEPLGTDVGLLTGTSSLLHIRAYRLCTCEA